MLALARQYLESAAVIEASADLEADRAQLAAARAVADASADDAKRLQWQV